MDYIIVIHVVQKSFEVFKAQELEISRSCHGIIWNLARWVFGASCQPPFLPRACMLGSGKWMQVVRIWQVQWFILVAGRICVPILSIHLLEVRVTHVGTVSRLRTPKMSQLKPKLLQFDRKPMDLRIFLGILGCLIFRQIHSSHHPR